MNNEEPVEKVIPEKKEILIKGKPRSEYMKDYMKEYRKRPGVQKKLKLNKQKYNKKYNKKKREEKLKKEIKKYQQFRNNVKANIDGIEIIDLARLDAKNRIVLGQNTCNILGAVSSDKIAIIRQGKHVVLIKFSNLRIGYR